ncbi:2-oxoglutarate (2OG) and Fe(II)-dependent oxygenase superfamily protein [Forsythia ovata]|uniref:2-oxoglutarate (2OG) and Fe(II)-dependent oxygenase superfamily protein n=1 Tax=Forsythia ovata TaxID=205694 RepID=A0ABD1XAW4_9LAMI
MKIKAHLLVLSNRLLVIRVWQSSENIFPEVEGKALVSAKDSPVYVASVKNLSLAAETNDSSYIFFYSLEVVMPCGFMDYPCQRWCHLLNGLWSSLPVPSVQEIVRNDANNVPERYIKYLEDRPLSSEKCPVSLDIPIINLSLLTNGDEDERKKLDLACKDWGFFQIINHGTDEVLPKMKAAVAAFFELPLCEKKKYAMAANDVQGYGQGYVVSVEQKLDWNDLLFLITMPSSFRNMKYWPITIPGFKETLEEYSIELQRVIDEIFSNLSLLMGMEGGFLKELQGVMKLGMRMNYYPTCSRPDLVLGVSPHSDCSSITLLLQDDDITALQIKHKEAWIPVKPVPNALVVNIGDVVEAWSNGLYKSIEHRAVTNEKKPRISVATFVIPCDDVELNPLETMVDDNYRPRIYKNDVKYVDYLRHTLARKMDGKATNLQYLKL